MLSRGAFLLTLARARFVAIGGQGFWIVPGSRGVCLVAPPHAAAPGCALAGGPASAESGLAATAQSGSQTLVYGLAPNGSRSVSIVRASGQDVRAPVRRNVFVAALRSQATLSSSGRRLVGLFKPDRPSSHRRSVAVAAGTWRSFRGCQPRLAKGSLNARRVTPSRRLRGGVRKGTLSEHRPVRSLLLLDRRSSARRQIRWWWDCCWFVDPVARQSSAETSASTVPGRSTSQT